MKIVIDNQTEGRTISNLTKKEAMAIIKEYLNGPADITSIVIKKRTDKQSSNLDIKDSALENQRNHALLSAAGWLDGYMKTHRGELHEAEEKMFYIAIRELVQLISPEYRKEREEDIKVLISTQEDWMRFRASQTEKITLFDLLKIVDDKEMYAAMIKSIVKEGGRENKIVECLEREYTEHELQLLKKATEDAAHDGHPITNQPVFFSFRKLERREDV